MTTWTYWRSIFPEAWQETIQFARRRILLTVAFGGLAVLLQWIPLHLRGWTDTQKVLITFLAAAAMITLLGHFPVALLRIPARRNQEICNAVDVLKRQLDEARAEKQVDPSEAHLREVVKEKLKAWTQEEKKFLRWLLDHGPVVA